MLPSPLLANGRSSFFRVVSVPIEAPVSHTTRLLLSFLSSSSSVSYPSKFLSFPVRRKVSPFPFALAVFPSFLRFSVLTGTASPFLPRPFCSRSLVPRSGISLFPRFFFSLSTGPFLCFELGPLVGVSLAGTRLTAFFSGVESSPSFLQTFDDWFFFPGARFSSFFTDSSDCSGGGSQSWPPNQRALFRCAACAPLLLLKMKKKRDPSFLPSQVFFFLFFWRFFR